MSCMCAGFVPLHVFAASLLLCWAGRQEGDAAQEVMFLQSSKHLVANLGTSRKDLHDDLSDEVIDVVGAPPPSDLIEDLDALLKRLADRKAFAEGDVETAGPWGPWYSEGAARLAEQDSQLFSNGSFDLFNPSVVQLPAGWGHAHERWLVAFRQGTFLVDIQDDEAYHMQTNSVVLAVLDSKWQRTRPLHILQSEDFFAEAFDCQRDAERVIFGPEDARLYVRDTRVMLLFNGRTHHAHNGIPCDPAATGRMFIAQLDPSLRPAWTRPILAENEEVANKTSLKATGIVVSPVVDDSDPTVFTANKLFYIEKNWSPFTATVNVPGSNSQKVMDALVYSVDPHVILHLEVNGHTPDARVGRVWNTTSPELDAWRGRRFAEAEDEAYLNYIHGGVSPLLVPARAGRPAYFLSVLHVRTNEDWWATICYNYSSYFYTFEAQPPFKVLGVGDTTLPLTQGTFFSEEMGWGYDVAFPVQLLWLENDVGGTDLAVMYGSGDRESRRLILTPSQLQTLMPDGSSL